MFKRDLYSGTGGGHRYPTGLWGTPRRAGPDRHWPVYPGASAHAPGIEEAVRRDDWRRHVSAVDGGGCLSSSLILTAAAAPLVHGVAPTRRGLPPRMGHLRPRIPWSISDLDEGLFAMGSATVRSADLQRLPLEAPFRSDAQPASVKLERSLPPRPVPTRVTPLCQVCVHVNPQPHLRHCAP